MPLAAAAVVAVIASASVTLSMTLAAVAAAAVAVVTADFVFDYWILSGSIESTLASVAALLLSVA